MKLRYVLPWAIYLSFCLSAGLFIREGREK